MLSFLPAVLEPMVRGGQFTPSVWDALRPGCTDYRRRRGARLFPQDRHPAAAGLEREAAACVWLRGTVPCARDALLRGNGRGYLPADHGAARRGRLLRGECPRSRRDGPPAGQDARRPSPAGRRRCPLHNDAAELLSYARARIRPSFPEENGRPRSSSGSWRPPRRPTRTYFATGIFACPMYCSKKAR